MKVECDSAPFYTNLSYAAVRPDFDRHSWLYCSREFGYQAARLGVTLVPHLTLREPV